MNKLERKRIDWLITLAPFISIMLLAGVLFVAGFCLFSFFKVWECRIR